MTATAPAGGRQLDQLLDHLREARYRAGDWWRSAGGYELRGAWHDARRAPGVMLAGVAAALWPWTGFSFWPAVAGVVAWLVVSLATLAVPWWIRRRIRRRARAAALAVVLLWLVWLAGPAGWLVTLGLALVAAGTTDRWRARRRLLAWLLDGVALAGRVNPASLTIQRPRWAGRQLLSAEVAYGPDLHDHEPARRDAITSMIRWRLRTAGSYHLAWSQDGRQMFTVQRGATLPDRVTDQEWPANIGLPAAVSDAESADTAVQERDDITRQVLSELPLRVYEPDNDRHMLIIGGTGSGKTVFVRGLIARGLRMGRFPGGVGIIDGKSSANYAPFRGRDGVLFIARDPEEWHNGLGFFSRTMRERYDKQWAYRTGEGPRPSLPRMALVIEECQEVRAVLGSDADRFYQQLGRQCREAGITLIIVTQRPDVADAIPGPVRDMLEDRIVLGFVSRKGAEMALEERWREAVDEYGDQMPPGRGVARIAGKYSRIQSMWLADPLDDPSAEALYPPRRVAVEAAPPAAQPQPLPGASWPEADPDAARPAERPRSRRRRTV